MYRRYLLLLPLAFASAFPLFPSIRSKRRRKRLAPRRWFIENSCFTLLARILKSKYNSINDEWTSPGFDWASNIPSGDKGPECARKKRTFLRVCAFLRGYRRQLLDLSRWGNTCARRAPPPCSSLFLSFEWRGDNALYRRRFARWIGGECARSLECRISRVPSRDIKREKEEGGVNALFVGMQMSTRDRARAPGCRAALCPMHNAEVHIIMVMRGEIWPVRMRRTSPRVCQRRRRNFRSPREREARPCSALPPPPSPCMKIKLYLLAL